MGLMAPWQAEHQLPPSWEEEKIQMKGPVVVATWIQKIQSVLINHHDHDEEEDGETLKRLMGTEIRVFFPLSPENHGFSPPLVVPFMDSDVQWILLSADSWETHPVAIAICIERKWDGVCITVWKQQVFNSHFLVGTPCFLSLSHHF